MTFFFRDCFVIFGMLQPGEFRKPPTCVLFVVHVIGKHGCLVCCACVALRVLLFSSAGTDFLSRVSNITCPKILYLFDATFCLLPVSLAL